MRMQLEGVTRSFGDAVVLDGIDFDDDVTTLAIIGPSGGGKSTLLRILGGLLAPSAGRVLLEDKLVVEAWTGKRFEPVRAVDLTRNLLHPGVMLLYLPRPLPEHTLFGQTGHWLNRSLASCPAADLARAFSRW